MNIMKSPVMSRKDSYIYKTLKQQILGKPRKKEANTYKTNQNALKNDRTCAKVKTKSIKQL